MFKCAVSGLFCFIVVYVKSCGISKQTDLCIGNICQPKKFMGVLNLVNLSDKFDWFWWHHYLCDSCMFFTKSILKVKGT